MMKIKTNLNSLPSWAPLVFLALLSTYIYWPILSLFYQQDEWHVLGHIYANGFGNIFALVSPLRIILGEGRILALLAGYFLEGKFALNALPMAIFTLIFQVINTLLVYIFIKTLGKNSFTAVIATLFFIFSSVSMEAVSWFGTSIGTLPSVTAIILSLIFFFQFQKTNHNKWLYYCFGGLYLSLFFKEIGIYLFLALPLIGFVTHKISWNFFIKRYWYFLLVFALVTLFRVLELRAIQTHSTLFLTGASSDFLSNLIVRAIFYPLTSFSLLFVPAYYSLSVAKTLTGIYYPFVTPGEFNLLAQTIVLDVVALTLSLLLSVKIVFLCITGSNKEKNGLLTATILILMSFLPYIIVSKTYSYLESRYYYLAAVFAAMLIAYLWDSYDQLFKKFHLKWLLLIGYFIFLGFHYADMQKNFDTQKNVSQQRQKIIQQILVEKPVLSQSKNIFYIRSDKDYYIDNNFLPFQQGIGYTLMTIYYPSGKIPRVLLDESYLWELNTQGYREIDGLGFGFFWDKQVLDKTLIDLHLGKDMVHVVNFNSEGDRIVITSYHE